MVLMTSFSSFKACFMMYPMCTHTVMMVVVVKDATQGSHAHHWALYQMRVSRMCQGNRVDPSATFIVYSYRNILQLSNYSRMANATHFPAGASRDVQNANMPDCLPRRLMCLPSHQPRADETWLPGDKSSVRGRGIHPVRAEGETLPRAVW